jgi:hypothetical protein
MLPSAKSRAAWILFGVVTSITAIWILLPKDRPPGAPYKVLRDNQYEKVATLLL